MSQTETTVAKQAFERALRIRETAYGPDHPWVHGLIEIWPHSDLVSLATSRATHSDRAPILLPAFVPRYWRSDIRKALNSLS